MAVEMQRIETGPFYMVGFENTQFAEPPSEVNAVLISAEQVKSCPPDSIVFVHMTDAVASRHTVSECLRLEAAVPVFLVAMVAHSHPIEADSNLAMGMQELKLFSCLQHRLSPMYDVTTYCYASDDWTLFHHPRGPLMRLREYLSCQTRVEPVTAFFAFKEVHWSQVYYGLFWRLLVN